MKSLKLLPVSEKTCSTVLCGMCALWFMYFLQTEGLQPALRGVIVCVFHPGYSYLLLSTNIDLCRDHVYKQNPSMVTLMYTQKFVSCIYHKCIFKIKNISRSCIYIVIFVIFAGILLHCFLYFRIFPKFGWF